MNVRRSLVVVIGAWVALTLVGSAWAAVPGDRHSACVRGQFVDSAGKAVADVEVVHRFWPGDSCTSKTDAAGRLDGSFAWSAKIETTWYELEARRFGCARYSYRAAERVRPDQVIGLGTIVLQPGGAISGSLVDEADHPLAHAGASVIDAAKSTPSPNESSVTGPDWSDVVDGGESDGSGKFDIVGLPPGKYALWLKHASSHWCCTKTFEVRAGERVEAGNFALRSLPPEWSVEGVVIDPTGAPVAGAKVSSSIPDTEHKTGTDVSFSIEFEAVTDAAGRFVLYLPQQHDDPIELEANVEPARFDAASVSNINPGARDVRIQLGAMREVELFVTDAADKPIEEFGWSIHVETDQWFTSSGEAPAHRAGGRAKLRVPVGKVSIEIRSDSFKREDALPVPDGPGVQSLHFRLGALGAVTGRVMFEGRPVAGAQVELVQREPNYIGDEVLPGHWSGLYYGMRSDRVTSDAQGNFRIASDFPHLKYFAHAWSPGFAEGFSTQASVGGPPVTVELARACTLEGEVFLPGGRSAAGLEISVFRRASKLGDYESDLGLMFRTAVDGTGHWKVDSLASGTWLVTLALSPAVAAELDWDHARVERCREVPWVFECTSDHTALANLDLAQESSVQLHGSTWVAGNRGHQPYAVLLLEPPLALQIASAGIDTDGRFELEVRKPGRYRVVIHSSPGGRGDGEGVITELVDLAPGLNEWKRK